MTICTAMMMVIIPMSIIRRSRGNIVMSIRMNRLNTVIRMKQVCIMSPGMVRRVRERGSRW
jgi:hypothetical protein